MRARGGRGERWGRVGVRKRRAGPRTSCPLPASHLTCTFALRPSTAVPTLLRVHPPPHPPPPRNNAFLHPQPEWRVPTPPPSALALHPPPSDCEGRPTGPQLMGVLPRARGGGRLRCLRPALQVQQPGGGGTSGFGTQHGLKGVLPPQAKGGGARGMMVHTKVVSPPALWWWRGCAGQGHDGSPQGGVPPCTVVVVRLC